GGPWHRGGQGQGRDLQAWRDHPQRAGARDGGCADRGDRQVGGGGGGLGDAGHGEDRGDEAPSAAGGGGVRAVSSGVRRFLRRSVFLSSGTALRTRQNDRAANDRRTPEETNLSAIAPGERNP